MSAGEYVISTLVPMALSVLGGYAIGQANCDGRVLTSMDAGAGRP